MKVLVSGASGLVGSAIIPVLEDAGHETLRLVRHPVRDPGAEMQWNPYAGSFDSGELPPFDAVIHLSGENIAGRWTSAKKRSIYDSRIRTTTFSGRVHGTHGATAESLVVRVGDRLLR
jgi:uncharacterized protein